MKLSNLFRLSSLAALLAVAVWAQTQIDLRTQAKSVDFSAASATLPSQTGAVLPTACQLGATFILTSAPAGQNWYICTSQNLWTLQSGAVPSQIGNGGSVLSTNGTSLQWNAFGGDISGTPTALSVNKLLGRKLNTAAPNAGQFLGWDGTQWTAQSLSLTSPVTSVFGRTGPVSSQTGDYSFAQIAGTVLGSQLPSAAGDLSGAITSATVTGLQNRAVSAAQPATGQVLAWNGTQWAPQSGSGGGSNLMTAGTVSANAPIACTDSTGALTTVGCSTGNGGLSGLTSGKIPQAASSSSLSDSNLAQDATTGQITSSKSISGPAASAGAATGSITIDLATCQRCEVPMLTGNITAVAFAHLKPGLKFSVVFTQAASGGPFGVIYGPSVVSNTTCAISTNANIVTTQELEVASDGARVYGKACSTTDTATEIAGPERTENMTSTSGNGVLDFSSGRHTATYYANASANVHIMPRTAGSTDQLASTDLSDSSGLTRDIAGGASLALPTGSMSNGACTTVTATATGVTTSDVVQWSPTASWKAITGYGGSTTLLTIYPAYPTAGQINIDVCNYTGSTLSSIGAAYVNWAVRR